MDKNFSKWFTRLIFATDILLLLASTPHLAAWIEHNNPTSDFVQSVWNWSIAYGLAFALDGTQIAILYGLLALFKGKVKAPWKIAGMILVLLLLSCFSWFVNTQYDIQYQTDAFSKADAKTILSVPLGKINPVAGGSFALLNIVYVLLSSIVQSEDQKEMTEEEFEREKKRIERENELRKLRQTNGNGLLNVGKEKLFGTAIDQDELLNKAVTYLRTVRELLPDDQEERAIQALSTYLNIRAKQVLPVLIQARAMIEREDQDRLISEATSEAENEQEQELNASTPEQEQDVEAMLKDLRGRDTVPLAIAARILNCQESYVIRLRNGNKLRHPPHQDDRITVASLREYMANRGKRTSTKQTEKLKVVTPTTDEHEAITA